MLCRGYIVYYFVRTGCWEYCDKAEEKHDMSLFLKSNTLRKTIKDKKQVVKDLYFSISKLEEEAKSVWHQKVLYDIQSLMLNYCSLFVLVYTVR